MAKSKTKKVAKRQPAKKKPLDYVVISYAYFQWLSQRSRDLSEMLEALDLLHTAVVSSAVKAPDGMNVGCTFVNGPQT